MDEERMNSLNASFDKRMEEAAAQYTDIKILLESHVALKKQPQWSESFLEGYMACISDLIIMKKML